MGEIEFFFLRRWFAGEEAKEDALDEFFGSEILKGKFGESVVVAESSEPDADGSVGNDGRLQGSGVVATTVDGTLAGGVPTEGGENIGNSLDTGKSEAEAVAFVGKAGKHPGAAWLAEVEGVFERAFPIDIDIHLFGVEGLADRMEEGVDDLFCLQATWSWRREKRRGFPKNGIDGALIGVGVEDETGDGFERIVITNEFSSEPAKKLRMGVLCLFPVAGLSDDTPSHELLPKSVDHDLGEAFILWRGDECGEEIAGVGRFLGNAVADVGIEKLIEGPGRGDFGTRWQGDFDKRFASAFGETFERDAGSLGNGERLSRKEGAELKEVFLE